jgi:dCMP deaminase
MKEKLKRAYMKTAETFAELSHARRLHVGAIVVKNDRIISIGYNGMPAGWDNNCEKKVYLDSSKLNQDCGYVYLEEDGLAYELKTKKEVLHAETNAIAKLARSNESGLGADMFITHAPCLDCAKLIYQSGIKRVWYGAQYRDSTGTEFLRKSGIEVEQLDE